jgi:tape measure domain-containing protein
MAGAVANLMVRAGFDGAKLQRGLQQMQEEVRGAQSSMKSSLGTMGTFATSTVAVVGAALIAAGGYIAKVGVQYDAMQESSQIAWTTLLGSTTKAKQMLQDISTFAKNTQFDTAGVDAMAKYFNNAGYAGKGLFDELQRIADISGAFNITAANAEELARQMSQVDQAGVAYTQDLDILQNQGIPIFKAIAKEVGTNVGAVRKMASEGKITSDVYNKAFNSIAKTVQGASDAQSKTFNGMMSTLKDDFSIMAGILAKPLFNSLHDGMTKLMPVMDGLVSLGRGDFKSFSNTMDQTFGPTVGGKILSFARNIQQGAQVLKSFVDKAKTTLKALFDYIKGDDMGGLTLLTKLGLDPEVVVKIDAVLMGIRGFITGFFSSVSSLFKGKNNFGSSFSENIQSAKKIVLPIMSDIVSGIKTAISQLSTFWKTNGKQIIQSVKDTFKMVADFNNTFLIPAFKAVWATIKTVGVPLVKDLIATLKIFGNSSAAWVQNIGGIVAAIAAFKIINTVVGLYKAWKEATIIMTAVQAAFDVALNANPIGVVALAIGALVAAGIYMYQHWGTISAGMASIWRSIERGAAAMVNGIIDKIDTMISVINHIPGVSIPLIPKVSWGNNPPPSKYASGSTSVGTKSTLAHFATGTNFAPGGISLVGENGPELVDLPRGSKVHTNYQTNNLPDAIASAVGTAVVQAMQFNKSSSGNTSGDVVLNIDGRTFARIIKPYTDLEQKRVGTKMTIQPI